MSEVVRLYQYKSLLVGRRAMSAEDLMARLEISRATLKRDIAKLRDQLHVPIEFDREAADDQLFYLTAGAFLNAFDLFA
jgi:predicted DNA-binding transcriptional regulator YafY